MDIKKEVNKIKDYILECLEQGSFSFVKADEHTAVIHIQNIQFEFWIGQYPESNLNFYSTTTPLGGTDLLSLTNQAQRDVAWKALKPFVEKYRKEVLTRELQKQLSETQEQLNRIGSHD